MTCITSVLIFYNCLLDSASQGMRVGVNLALAIALHNIPEVHILSIRNLWRRSYLPTYIAHLIKRNLKRIPHYYYFYVFPVWMFVFHYKAISKTSKQLDLIFFFYLTCFLCCYGVIFSGCGGCTSYILCNREVRTWLHMDSHLYHVYSGVLFILNRYYACNSKWQAFKLATLSGLAEPLGVIIVGKSALVSLLMHSSFEQVNVLLRVSSEYHKLIQFPYNAAYLFPSSLSPEILEGLLGAGK